MLIEHARYIFRSNGERRRAYCGHYLSFATGRRENNLLELGDLTLLLLLEAREELLELLCFIRLPAPFGSHAVCLKHLTLLL
jgi:hypothetical protein